MPSSEGKAHSPKPVLAGSVSVKLGVRVVDNQAETALSPRGELGKQRMMAITINTW